MTKDNSINDNLKLCECNKCAELIPNKDKYGRSKRFKIGHNHIGKRSNGWKGGKILKDRYCLIYKPHHKYCNHKGYVYEHRYIIELQLGRYLTKTEVVHHIDKNKSNNKINNLMLFESDSKHISYERKKDMSNRFCLLCKSKETYTYKNNNKIWYKYNNGFVCGKCFRKSRNNK